VSTPRLETCKDAVTCTGSSGKRIQTPPLERPAFGGAFKVHIMNMPEREM